MLENSQLPEPTNSQGAKNRADYRRWFAAKMLNQEALTLKYSRKEPWTISEPQFPVRAYSNIEERDSMRAKACEVAAGLVAAMLDTKTEATQKHREICDALRDLTPILDGLGLMDSYRQDDGFGLWSK